ncbi:MAG: ABC transporter permease subunit [Alphaproteobacteria bacterium]|nr:MAG: ABC transporter permease subunit [Alphaproteobacteria bacterium]
MVLPWAWLVLFFLLPFLFVLEISFAEAIIARPPYRPPFAITDDGLVIRLSLFSYRFILGDPLYFHAWLKSLLLAASATLLALLLGYPMAWSIARTAGRRQVILLALVILPFWTSFLLRVYSWKLLLQGNGPLNHLLIALGVIEHPLRILHSDWAVLLGLVYSYLPFMILPLYAQLQRIDLTLIEAAQDLGATPPRAFRRVILPLSMPGIMAGSMLVFIPAVGEYVIPELLGGPDSTMIGRVLWNEFFANRDWPMAASLAVLMLVVLIAPLALFERAFGRLPEADDKGKASP